MAALRHPSPTSYWQSDGPQPHLLNIHFFKLVDIERLRVYLDFELDESYTPTKMVFLAGCHGASGYGMCEFAVWEADGPRGWVEIPLTGVGVGAAVGAKRPAHGAKRDVLRAMVVQVRICENHQNGKDTHVRGLQIFARDERGVREDLGIEMAGAARGRTNGTRGEGTDVGAGGVAAGEAEGPGQRKASPTKESTGAKKGGGRAKRKSGRAGDVFALTGSDEPDWMREPELR